jgi:hypothetical protein
MDPWNKLHIFMLRIVTFALDAAVDHPGLDITEELYEELLLEAGRRMQAEVGTYLPAYPEALERVARVYVEKLEQPSS